MYLVRFMGIRELMTYLSGETLENHTDWRGLGKSSDSVGFCFFDDSQDPAYRCSYVSGQCNISFVATFAVNPLANLQMRKSVGKYRDPLRDKIKRKGYGKIRRMDVTEYSMERYSNSMLILKKLGKPYRDAKGCWQIHDIDQQELEEIINGLDKYVTEREKRN